MQAEGDRGGDGVAVTLGVHVEPARDPQALLHDLHGRQARLVRDHPLHGVEVRAALLHHLGDEVGQELGAELEDGLAVHLEVEEVPDLLGVGQRVVLGAAPHDLGEVGARAVGLEARAEDLRALVGLGEADHHGGGRVPEDGGALLVLPVEPHRGDVGRDDEDPAVAARRDQVGHGVEGDHEAQAGRVDVEGGQARVLEAERLLDQGGGAGDSLLGGAARADQAIDVVEGEPCRLEGRARGLGAHLRGGLAVGEVAREHARLGLDPARRDAEHPVDVRGAQDPFGQVFAGAENPDRALLHRGESFMRGSGAP
ncbi:hypothetical protein D3C86_1482980 [compost metagenome]